MKLREELPSTVATRMHTLCKLSTPRLSGRLLPLGRSSSIRRLVRRLVPTGVARDALN